MAAQVKAPSFPGNFNAVIQNFIVNDIPIDEELYNTIPTEYLTQFKKATINAAYWNRRLLEEINPVTLIIGFITHQGLQIFNIQQFLEILKTVIPISKIAMVFPTESQNFMGIVLKDSESANLIFEKLKYYGDAAVIFLGKSDSNNIPIKILWSTPSISLESVNKSLLPYFESIELKREIIDFQEVKVPSGTIVGTASIKSGLLLDNIPYVLEINGNVKKRVLLLIKGRPTICLKCGEKGHIRRQCSALKCTFCKKFHPSNYYCSEGQNRLFTLSKPSLKIVPGLNISVPEYSSNYTSLGRPKSHQLKTNNPSNQDKKKIVNKFNNEKIEVFDEVQNNKLYSKIGIISENMYQALNSDESEFEMNSEEGDYIGKKEDYSVTDKNGLEDLNKEIEFSDIQSEMESQHKSVKRARKDCKEGESSINDSDNLNCQPTQNSGKSIRNLRSPKKIDKESI